ncbi:hypothetical protein N8371_09345 [Vicingaceae bacterium]|nr:hypothetical protein [Vicingaceae bacterium]
MSKFYVKAHFFLVLLCLSFGFSFGQAADATAEAAKKRYDKEDYFGALYDYERAMKIDSINLEVLFGYGKTLLAVNNPKEASIYLKKARALDYKKTKKELGYLLAESYRLAGDYRNARKFYNYALVPYRKDRKGFMYKRVSISKEANNWANKQAENNKALNSLGDQINTPFSEFGAQVYAGNIYYSALVGDSMGPGNVILDKDYFSKIYYTHTANKKETLQFNNRDAGTFRNKHISNPSFIGSILFFTACDTSFNCEIYRGKVKGNIILQVKKLNKNINNTVSNNTQPHAVVEQNDTILYFVSDRDLGFGGFDIWRSKKEGFGFGQPVNVGNSVNSPDHEITPFFDVKSHQLFFSSNWHLGFGGYDIFKSEKQGIKFKTPQNLGRPINSSYHDYYFFPHEEMAILSSNRTEGNIVSEVNCCNDLFKLKYERKLMNEEDKLNIVKTKINEEELNKYLPLSLYFHNDRPKASSSDTSTNSNFIDLAEQYIELQDEYEKKYIKTLALSKQQKERSALNQFFEDNVAFGQEQLEEITPLLLKELEKGNQIELAVRGYASSLSTSDYNFKLASRRIESLINFLKFTENGAINQYLNSRMLMIRKLPLGDYAVSKVQEEDNKLAAVYSTEAAIERKIEIIALRSSSNSQLNKTEQPKLEIPKDKFLAIYRKGSTVERGFLLKNTGNDTLKIYQIIADEKVVRTNPVKYIPKNSSERIVVEVITTDFDGPKTIEILLITNDPKNNMRKIEIELRPTN